MASIISVASVWFYDVLIQAMPMYWGGWDEAHKVVKYLITIGGAVVVYLTFRIKWMEYQDKRAERKKQKADKP